MITNRKFQNMYILCQGIVNGTFGKNDLDEKGQTVFKPFVSQGSALGYAAKRFTEKNEKGIRQVDTDTKDIAYKFALVDKDTKEILYNNGGHGPYGFRFDKDNLKKYEQEIGAYYDEETNFTIEEYICPPDKLPAEIPFELEALNGFILKHDFWQEC